MRINVSEQSKREGFRKGIMDFIFKMNCLKSVSGGSTNEA